jgi:hypothetical protein
MKLTVDLASPHLSPTERLVLGNLADRMRPAPRPVPEGHAEALDEALGKPDRAKYHRN